MVQNKKSENYELVRVSSSCIRAQIFVHAFDGGMYIRGLKGSPLGGLSYEPNFK